MECFQRSTIEEIMTLRDNFWKINDKNVAPSRQQRKAMIFKLLTLSFDNILKEFKFFVGKRQVCEMGYLRILGINCRLLFTVK